MSDIMPDYTEFVSRINNILVSNGCDELTERGIHLFVCEYEKCRKQLQAQQATSDTCERQLELVEQLRDYWRKEAADANELLSMLLDGRLTLEAFRYATGAQQVESAPCEHDWILHCPNDNLEQCSRCNLYRDRPADSDGFWIEGAELESNQQ